jgi:hypothetical protein
MCGGDTVAELRRRGLTPPRLYDLGYEHNNCGGFCFKAGQRQFAHLLRQDRPRYLYHEGKEQEMREYLGKDISILRDRRGGVTRPMTLRAFRLRLEDDQDYDQLDAGSACDCMGNLNNALR